MYEVWYVKSSAQFEMRSYSFLLHCGNNILNNLAYIDISKYSIETL